jgi:hypothetical protein
MTASNAVETYLEQVEAQLPGGRRSRVEVLDELRDGLLEALEEPPSTSGVAQNARPQPSGDPVLRELSAESGGDLLVREFGHPREIGTALGREMRIRLARRHAAWVLVVLLTTGLGWQLYNSFVGVSESMIPSGWAEPVFLIGIEVLQFAAPAAQVGAALTIVAVSLPIARLTRMSAPIWLGRVTAGALIAFAAGALAMMFSIAPAHRLDGVLVGIPVMAFALLALEGARRTIRYTASSRVTWLYPA